MRLCAEEGCGAGGKLVKGLCGKHYQRIHKSGGPFCMLIENGVVCSKHAVSFGLCPMHRRRADKNDGDPFQGGRKPRPVKEMVSAVCGGPCGLEKPLSDYPAQPGKHYPLYCRACLSERRAIEFDMDPDKRRNRDNAYLVRTYNITIEQYEHLVAQQGGKCGNLNCRRRLGKRRLAVDHDKRCCPGHRSCGKCVRGLLCGICNTWLGVFEICEDNGTNKFFSIWRDQRIPFIGTSAGECK